MLNLLLIIGGTIGIIVVAVLLFALLFRRVVNNNEVHIVQSSTKTMSYGKDTGNGNSYYEFPSWIPKVGVSKIVLPASVFLSISKITKLTTLRDFHLSLISLHFLE